MTYVISDIHGEYEKYISMLEMIDLRDEDTLYVLGDVVDRGERPIDILRDMMLRPNVIPIVGNHELIAADILRDLMVEVTEENYATHVDLQMMKKIMQWQRNGGDTTMKQFRALSGDEREYVLEYFDEFLPYEIVSVGEQRFLLVHAGLGGFREGRPIEDYSLEELTFSRPDYEKKYFAAEDVFVVSGHTPTLAVSGKAEIYKSHGNILIDCGAAFDGRLACLRLDDMKEFYV